jgi:hypothetical protein
MSWLKMFETEYLKEDNEYYLVMLDIADLMKNCHGVMSDPKEYAARAIGMVLKHIERTPAHPVVLEQSKKEETK